ncbi:MAG: DNA-directed RNA polymerase subunit beta [Proteobacteria bacterium]|nr:DNA-directed RNA polymerase subunit beta [Pseudomonadota bacterium]MBQ4360116.1 DNA-directed RNA polymerase subunit beta [Pseudomonadota bacterium]
MASVIQSNFRARRSYATSKCIVDVPNLIDIQRKSYEAFLQADVPPEERTNTGLQGVFRGIFPIRDFNEVSELDFVDYALEESKYDVEECHSRGMTYEAPVKVNVRLTLFDKDEAGNKSIHDIQDQQVYFGAIPLMTPEGTFIINGTERVVVSQLHRSPGVFFDNDAAKHTSAGKLNFSARIIPYRGSWIDFEFDTKEMICVRIDRRRKMYATILLRALGYSTEELLKMYYDIETITIDETGIWRPLERKFLMNQRSDYDIVDPKEKDANGDPVVYLRAPRKFNAGTFRKLANAGITRVRMSLDALCERVAAEDYYNEDGEVILECNQQITEEIIEKLGAAGINEIKVLYFDDDALNVGRQLSRTLAVDKCSSPENARLEIYARTRPGDPPTVEQADALFDGLFRDPEKYDLSKVGRLKLNKKFKLNADPDHTTLDNEDIIETVRYLIDLAQNKNTTDDIDHLGNRRVRAVGELLENQYRNGLARMERAIKERMTMSQATDMVKPHDLINAKPVVAVVREYFGSSQLSQFMDQTNPLSELTHKRRLSALGPGGLTRERAGFEVRDVHPTHYGRICPIETPEGPNIGLIASLSTYARVNEYGFIETPYRRVEDRKVLDDVDYLSALDEDDHNISPANITLTEDGLLPEGTIECHQNGELVEVPSDQIDYIDISPNQMVSVAAALVPFLENDDANRALMGANMQRQAVPLLVSEAPWVGTGMERLVARDSGVAIHAKHAGTVERVDATRIVIRADRDETGLNVKPDIYNLYKYRRSNQGTCFNQIPAVNVGDHVKVGEVIADGPSTDCGELALGKNVVVAFVPWCGYNYEDAILLSERMVIKDVYTSIHIEEFECIARDTKLGKEEITRDIPNVGEEALKDLDESGIIRIGAEIKPGDILVGKVTPKGETQLSPEEKLLRAIFGEKAGDVRDSSQRVPPGLVGTVIDAKVFCRKKEDTDERTREIDQAETERLNRAREVHLKIIRDGGYQRIREFLLDHKTTAPLIDSEGKTLLKKGADLTAEVLSEIPNHLLKDIMVKDTEVMANIAKIGVLVQEQISEAEAYYEDKFAKLEKGDELPPGVIKIVKVSVAIKRKIQVGDKMAGRHGNKGVVSNVLPIEDMPYLEDGTPVDFVLNPLGVPSRMNIGQILEIHLGWGARGMGRKIDALLQAARAGACEDLRAELKIAYPQPETVEFLDSLDDDGVIDFAKKCNRGIHVATPVFDGAREKDIHSLLEHAGLDLSAKSTLFDGRTGEPFANDVTVGVMYMLKLHHLVDEKIHARSIGPYSLVTQQPLGGKTQFGGQRLGEMEVWAMMAYGAAYSLKEFLTVKSDDVTGRTRMYESIVKGDFALEAGLPESFNVLLNELKSLCLNVELLKEIPKI